MRYLKTVLKIVAGLILVFVILCVFLVAVAPEAPVQNKTTVSESSATPVITPTNSEVNTQDVEDMKTPSNSFPERLNM